MPSSGGGDSPKECTPTTAPLATHARRAGIGGAASAAPAAALAAAPSPAAARRAPELSAAAAARAPVLDPRPAALGHVALVEGLAAEAAARGARAQPLVGRALARRRAPRAARLAAARRRTERESPEPLVVVRVVVPARLLLAPAGEVEPLDARRGRRARASAGRSRLTSSAAAAAAATAAALPPPAAIVSASTPAAAGGRAAPSAARSRP